MICECVEAAAAACAVMKNKNVYPTVGLHPETLEDFHNAHQLLTNLGYRNKEHVSESNNHK